MSFYPVFLTRIDEREVILIGGNEEAARKAGELIEFGARLTIISETLNDELMMRHRKNEFRWINRRYRSGDLENACFVVAAEYDEDLAKAVAAEARDRNILVNIMDNREKSDCAFGSIIRQGDLTISFSTNGIAPALAVRLKEKFRQELGDAYGEFLELARALRPQINALFTDAHLRKQKWFEWVDSDVIAHLGRGERGKAIDLTSEIWGEEAVRNAGLRD